MKHKLISLLILILTLILTACSNQNILGNAEIDWVDFVILNDIHYMGNYQGGNKLLTSNIGQVFGEVKFKVSDNIKHTNYKIKNGDSAFLDKGTKFYKIQGYKPEFRIACKVNGEWRIYEADTNPNAKKGEDLLDIRDKVTYIGINSETDGKTELGAITDKDSISSLVDMVLNADVDQNVQDHDGQRYFISFQLSDGSNVTRCFWANTNELSRGILLPKEFGIEISASLSAKD